MKEFYYLISAPDRSTTFIGHVPAAAGFICFSLFALLILLRRARNILLMKNSHKDGRYTNDSVGEILARRHIPEKDPAVLRTCGTIIVILTGAAIALETSTHFKDPFYMGYSLHNMLNFGFMAVGIAAILESFGRVPQGTWCVVTACSLFLESLMFHAHAMMKDEETDLTMHVYVSYYALVNSFVFMYSVMKPQSVIAYISSLCLMFLQGCWFITIGLYMGGFEIPFHKLSTILGCQVIVVILIVMFAVAIFVPPSADKHRKTGHNSYQNDRDLEDVSDELFSPLTNVEE